MRVCRLAVWASAVVVGAGVLTATTIAKAGIAVNRPPLAEFLRQTLDQLAFQEVLDLAPRASMPATAPATVDKEAEAPLRNAAIAAPQPIFQQPQINATVFELDRLGRVA